MRRPDPEIPLDEAAAFIAAHAHPDLDVGAVLGALDELAAETAAEDAEALARFLFVERGFAGNTVDYADPRNSYLDDVLDRRLGIPISLSVSDDGGGPPLRRARRRRRHARALPGPPAGGDANVWFDPFHGGRASTKPAAAPCSSRCGRSAAFSADYLAPVDDGAIVSRMLANLQHTFMRRDPAARRVGAAAAAAHPRAAPGERRRWRDLLGTLGRFARQRTSSTRGIRRRQRSSGDDAEQRDSEVEAAATRGRAGTAAARSAAVPCRSCEATRLPMFPLGSVLFPHAVLPLHVFEPRYRALTEACLAGDGEFGVVLIERGSEVGGGDTRFSVGTVARIVEAGRLPDGRYLLATVGHPAPAGARVAARGARIPRAEVELLEEPGRADARRRAAPRRRRAAPERVLAMPAELGESAAAGRRRARRRSRARASFEAAAARAARAARRPAPARARRRPANGSTALADAARRAGRAPRAAPRRPDRDAAGPWASLIARDGRRERGAQAADGPSRAGSRG